MPDDSAVLPPAGRTRRAGDTVPTLREAVEAVVDGQAVAWDDAEQRGRTPLERRMTRQLRDLALLAGLDASAEGVGATRAWPQRICLVLAGVAVVQCLAGIGAALVRAWSGDAAAWHALGPFTLVLLAGVAWRHRPRRAPGAADLSLLLAAWAARAPIEALAASSRVWALLASPLRLVHVEAALPALILGVALTRTSRPRFTARDRIGQVLMLLAVASSGALAPALVATRFPDALPLVAAASAVIAMVVLLRWGRLTGAVPRVSGRTASIGPTFDLRTTVRDAFAAWRGMHADRLASLTATVHRARTPREIAAELARQVVDGAGAPRAVVLAPGRTEWTSIAGEPVSLPSASGLVALLEGTEHAVRVDPASRMFAWLPASDRGWLLTSGIGVVARLAAPDGHTLGAILVGTRGDGRAPSRRTLSFVSAAAGTAGVALAALATAHEHTAGHGASPSDELPYECRECGRLSPEAARCACGGATALAALPAVLNEVFALERRIGRGGMGVVYRAYDTRLDRLVALKTLPALAPAAAHALQAEARAMAALEHPSIASLYGLERWRGTPVLVVEYLAGGTLAARIASGPMRPGDAVALARVLAEALATLHARGWLHGDIKPSNIGLTRDGVPKLLDFGLTRWHAMTAPAAGTSATARPTDGTRSGAVAGTPLYLSPEALDGHPAGDADDVWALALVIVELITGVHPFRADTLEDVAARVKAHATVDVRRWVPGTPSWLAEALAAALHPDRSRRVTCARALADRLAGPAAHESRAAAS